jgi:hypothetical protein
MKEKELRERIEQFLRKTARNVVVPASVGLGLGVSGCDQHALRAKAADAGGDSAAQISDVAKVSTSDLPPDGAGGQGCDFSERPSAHGRALSNGAPAR